MNIRNTFSVIISLALVGCLSVPNSGIGSKPNPATLTDSMSKQSNIFTYRFAPGLPQVQAIVRGSFIQKDDCLFLEYRNELYSPILPSGVSIWKPKENILTVFGKIVPLGKPFSTNGAYLEYSKELRNADSIVSYPSDQCTEKKVVMIGTEGFY